MHTAKKFARKGVNWLADTFEQAKRAVEVAQQYSQRLVIMLETGRTHCAWPLIDGAVTHLANAVNVLLAVVEQQQKEIESLNRSARILHDQHV